MTTIIGLEYDDSCVIVADSLTTDDSGYMYNHPQVKKIAEINGYLIAGSGEVLPCDVAQHIWEPPIPTKADNKDVYHFMIAKVMPSLRKTLQSNGFNFDEPKTEQRFQFLIALCGEIFDIDDSLGVSRNASNVYAAGSGAAYALGALHAGISPEEAMAVCAKLDSKTSEPFIIETQVKK